MGAEFSPASGMYTAEDLARIRQDVRDRALRAHAARQAAAETPQPVRPAAYQAPVPPTHQPASVPVRVARSTQPVSAPVARVSAPVQEVITSKSTAVDRIIEKRKPRMVRAVVTLGVLGVAAYGAHSAGFLGSDTISGVTNASFIGVDAPAESQYGEIDLPTVAQAEGLNIENCKKPDAAIATIRITGNYALRYQLQTPENTVAIPAPYMKEGSLSTGEGAIPENKKFETISGYPEMTIHDLPLEIYACEKANTAAITQSGGVDTINAANIEFSVKPVIPAEQDNKIQTEAYMAKLGPATFYTWPSQTFLKPNAERYTDASVQAASDAHASADQQIGAFNVAIQNIVASASDANPGSPFNQSVSFVQKDVDNIYDAIKEGLEVRLGSKNIEWNGTIGGLTPVVSDKRPALIDTTSSPEDSFKVVEGEVIVGRYAESSKDEE